MFEYITTRLASCLPILLWIGFVVSIIAGNTNLAILNVLLLLYHRIDQMEIQVIINNNTVNMRPKTEESE
jgi:hypothetical protein